MRHLLPGALVCAAAANTIGTVLIVRQLQRMEQEQRERDARAMEAAQKNFSRTIADAINGNLGAMATQRSFKPNGSAVAY